jgi:hypothetical protein
MVVDYIIVALLGGLVGLGELASRYREHPYFALMTLPAMVYIVVNMAASAGALALIDTFGWTFGIESGTRTVQVLIASFGAMAFLRSALFVVRIGTEDIPVGPGAFLTSITETADAAVNRTVEAKKLWARADVARFTLTAGPDWTFDRVCKSLPIIALALKGDVTPDVQEELAHHVVQLREADISDSEKIVTLGLTLISLVGEDAVRGAIHTIVEVYFADEDKERWEEEEGDWETPSDKLLRFRQTVRMQQSRSS